MMPISIRSGAASARCRRWMRGALAAGGLLAVLGLGGCHDREPAGGLALYTEHCALCHGTRGRGQNPTRPGGSLAPELEGWIAPALDMRGHCFVHSRAQLIAIIRDGSSQKGSTMLAFKDRLTEEDIGEIVSYLETLWDPATRGQYEARGRTAAKLAK
jgi:mono/diheme cytochrome c family protein